MCPLEPSCAYKKSFTFNNAKDHTLFFSFQINAPAPATAAFSA
jgi:hypothetical protein